jgi:putative methionine-R-sulfoxide reductase with GAF domain
LAVPILDADGKVLGTLGVGKVEPYDFSDTEKKRLAEIGEEFLTLF